MSRIMQSWYGRTGPERFETYTRWTLYILIAFVPLLALGVAGASEAPPTVMTVVAYPLTVTVQAAVAIATIRAGVTAFKDAGPAPRGLILAMLVVTAVAAAVALIWLPPATQMGWYGRGAGLLIVLLLAVFALTPVLETGMVTALSLGVSVVAVLTNLPAMDTAIVVSSGVLFGIIAVAMALSFRISIWMLGVVWEQERTRGLHARLAVAEERLRFSRDLHDVVGRALSAVALKSELAAELARRDQGEAAAAQMLEVRELANDSLREVRGVVAGYRQADLATELAGARSMLRSAGVRTRVIGDDTALPPRVQSALAWVVREGVTNVVRHSDASTCTIDLSVNDDGEGPVARLVLTNDGVTAPPGTGSGLLGLSERLAPLGGTVGAQSAGESFILTATVPCVPHDGGRSHAPSADSPERAAPPAPARPPAGFDHAEAATGRDGTMGTP